jgi:hypothetical protein
MPISTTEVALVAPAIAVCGTLLGAWAQSRRDERRWLRDRELETQRWTRDDRARWADRRFDVHSDFLAATGAWIDSFADYVRYIEYDWHLYAAPDHREAEEMVEHTLGRLELLSSAQTREAATTTRTAILEAANLVQIIDHATGDLDDDKKRPPTDEELAKLKTFVSEARSLRNRYIDLAQQELGTTK